MNKSISGKFKLIVNKSRSDWELFMKMLSPARGEEECGQKIQVSHKRDEPEDAGCRFSKMCVEDCKQDWGDGEDEEACARHTDKG